MQVKSDISLCQLMINQLSMLIKSTPALLTDSGISIVNKYGTDKRKLANISKTEFRALLNDFLKIKSILNKNKYNSIIVVKRQVTSR